MKLSSFEAVVRALNEASVRYLVAGGLAVDVHGYLRLTNDIDIVIQLVPDNVTRALGTLEALGYRPLAPVTAEQFADRATREGWIREKGMQVLQLWSDKHVETSIDICAYEPFVFDEEFSNALIKPLYGTVEVRFVTIPTLIKMMESAGRVQDRIDIEHLRMRLEMAENESPTNDFDWRLTTFEGSRREQLSRWARLPLERTVAALEEMQELSAKLASLSGSKAASRQDSGSHRMIQEPMSGLGQPLR
jgi:hypothetical protein